MQEEQSRMKMLKFIVFISRFYKSSPPLARPGNNDAVLAVIYGNRGGVVEDEDQTVLEVKVYSRPYIHIYPYIL